MSAPTTQLSLPKQVAQAREKLLTVIREADPEAARWVEEIRAKRRKNPSVVVVGETNRGKSSLVNALLARPGLSPVDAEVATATYLVFGHAENWEARACYPGQLAPVPIELSELINWVSAAHELPEGQLPPRYVEVDGRSVMLGEANTLRALSTTLSELRVKLDAERRALSTGEAEADALRARKEELTNDRRSSTKGWQVRLRSEVQRMRLEHNHEVSRQMRDMQSWFRQAIDASDKDTLATLPAQVDAALHLVSGRISAMLAHRLNQVT